MAFKVPSCHHLLDLTILRFMASRDNVALTVLLRRLHAIAHHQTKILNALTAVRHDLLASVALKAPCHLLAIIACHDHHLYNVVLAPKACNHILALEFLIRQSRGPVPQFHPNLSSGKYLRLQDLTTNLPHCGSCLDSLCHLDLSRLKHQTTNSHNSLKDQCLRQYLRLI